MNDYSLDNLKKLVSDSIKERSFKEQEWTRNLKWYNSRYYTEMEFSSKTGLYSVNLAYAVVRTIVSSIYAKNPGFSIYITSDRSQESRHNLLAAAGGSSNQVAIIPKLTAVLEIELKKDVKSLKIDRVNRRVVTDACIFGYGATIQGYNIITNKDVEKDIRNPEKLRKIGLTPSDIEASALVRSEESYVTRIDPRTLLFPDDENWGNFDWICREVYMSKAKAEKKYKRKFTTTNSIDFYKNNTKVNKDQVKFYEFHSFDEEDPRLVVFAHGDTTILENKEYPTLDKTTGRVKSLINVLWFNESIDGEYPASDVSLVAPQIAEANVQVNRRAENSKKYTNQYQVRGNWEQSQLDKLKTGEDGTYVQSSDPKASIDKIQKLTNGAEFYENIRAIHSEMLEVLGLTDYAMGGQTQKRKATEANIMESSSRDKVTERLTIIEEFFHDQIDLNIELYKSYMINNKKLVTSYAGEAVEWNFGAELLKLADLDLCVIGGSSIELDRNFEMKRAVELAKISQAFGNVINLPVLAKRILERLGEKDVDELLLSQEPQPVPAPGGNGGAAVRSAASQAGAVDQTQAQNGGVQ